MKPGEYLILQKENYLSIREFKESLLRFRFLVIGAKKVKWAASYNEKYTNVGNDDMSIRKALL